MKELKISSSTNKSLFYICPYCGYKIRKVFDSTIQRVNYKRSTECFSCKKRVVLIGPVSGIYPNKKIICPVCNKNKIRITSKCCRECFEKDRHKYVQRKKETFL
jgi:DNA-directed RNA polymerase subunit RPC12/RpoP